MKQTMNLTIFILCLAPAVAFAAGASNDDLAAQLADKPELRFVKLVNDVLDGNNASFQIRVLCNEAFNVKSLYATARNPNGLVSINYTGANLLGNPFGSEFSPPTNWLVAHEDFLVTVSSRSVGYELLSNMKIPSLGVGTGGSFDILGSRTPNTQSTTLTIGAVVETPNKLENLCRIVVVDF